MVGGLKAFEALAKPLADKYSYGLRPILFWLPLWRIAFGMDSNLRMCPTIGKVYEHIRDLEAFRAGDWRNQADTPEDERPQ